MKPARAASIALMFFLLVLVPYSLMNAPTGSVRGVYDNEPRLADKHVDAATLISKIKAANANTYNYLVGHEATDWTDLPAFLDAADEAGIDVWVTLLPPSESPPYGTSYSEPHRLDFLAWAHAISNLSASHKSLKAWSIDNLNYDCAFFTDEYLDSIVKASKETRVELKFIPVVYYTALGMPACQHLFRHADAVQFYYRHESSTPDVASTDTLADEINAMRARGRPVILGLYASCLAENACPSAVYVRSVLEKSQGLVDGWMVYTMQPDKAAFAPVAEIYGKK